MTISGTALFNHNVSGGFYLYLHCRPDGAPFYVGKGRGRRAAQETTK